MYLKCGLFLFTALAMVADAKLTMSYYDLLGMTRDCTEGELKKRYRKLAKDFHPDRIVDPKLKEEAAEKFMVIAKGYEVLSDPEIRKKYDELVKAGIYEYDEDEYEEWDARRNGWRSKAEIEWVEGLALYTALFSVLACGGGGLYYSHKEKEEKAKRAASQHQSFIAKLDKQRPRAEDTQTSSSALSKSQLLLRKTAHQKALKVYHKALKKALRAKLERSGLWFAPTFSSSEISALCVGLSPDELTKYTVALCDALNFKLPSPPPPMVEDQEDTNTTAEEPIEGTARQILKALKLRSTEMAVSST